MAGIFLGGKVVLEDDTLEICCPLERGVQRLPAFTLPEIGFVNVVEAGSKI